MLVRDRWSSPFFCLIHSSKTLKTSLQLVSSAPFIWIYSANHPFFRSVCKVHTLFRKEGVHDQTKTKSSNAHQGRSIGSYGKLRGNSNKFELERGKEDQLGQQGRHKAKRWKSGEHPMCLSAVREEGSFLLSEPSHPRRKMCIKPPHHRTINPSSRIHPSTSIHPILIQKQPPPHTFSHPLPTNNTPRTARTPRTQARKRARQARSRSTWRSGERSNKA